VPEVFSQYIFSYLSNSDTTCKLYQKDKETKEMGIDQQDIYKNEQDEIT